MFNVGDTVKIKSDADKIRTTYLGYANAMRKYLGTESTICFVDTEAFGSDRPIYKLEGVVDEVNKNTNGDGHWEFASEWLELIPVEIAEVTSTEVDDILNG